MKKENVEFDKLSFVSVSLDSHDLVILIESLQTLLHHRVSDCDDNDVASMFHLLSYFKKLKNIVQGPF